ncbi:MAG TPA: general secretion pathway protein GspB [Lysobacter sp.]
MSLILDALRKSEAERRRGQAPDLYAELPPLVSRVATRRPAWPWWLVAGLALLAALWMLRGVQSGAGVVSAPNDEMRPGIAAQPASAPLAPPAPAPVVIAPAAAPPAAVVPAPITPDPTRDTVASVAASVSKPDLAQAAQAVVSSSAVPDASAPVPKPAPLPPLPEPASQAPQSTPQPVASAAPGPPAPATAPATTAPLRLADLSAGEREQLPALKISMHMWGPAPAQRFAIIDGARVGQGDRVGDAVVEEIAADAVVLNWHGQRVALPIR